MPTGIEYIKSICSHLDLPFTTTGGALIFYLRFEKSTENRPSGLDVYLPAAAAVLLATKIFETPKRLRDIINSAYAILNPEDPPLILGVVDSGNSPQESIFWGLRRSVIMAERILVNAIDYDFNICFPHSYIEEWTHQAISICDPSYFSSKNTLVLNYAWGFAHSSLEISNVILKHTPITIAKACVLLSFKKSGINASNLNHWISRLSSKDYQAILEVCSSIQQFSNK
ncbi:Cyclin-L1 [Entomophthora muscae]|uniref:Cyclin-L1 n=1 Tax=Entomophthora muscae TaxID=34485 RepID=A0ACC2TIP4_9FUNG|nr:Cyclin-L1 [Entomophthora muscae]